jgi:molecular chaperone GrpE
MAGKSEAADPRLENAENARPEGESGAASEAAQVSPEEQVEALKVQLDGKNREIAELKDKYLRALAEQENARKRLRQQAEENLRMQREALLRGLLPIVDDLERAVAAARGGGNGKSIVEGVEMVLRSVQEFLRGYGVTPREAIGQPFNPQFHEAVDQVESSQHPPNTVISEFARGYQIEDRTLRPARVAVATGAKVEGDKQASSGGKAGRNPDGNVENS